MVNRIRIFVADDHPLLLNGLLVALNLQPDFEVVGKATTGDAALELITSLKPDVAVLDLEMPGLDGLQVLRRLREASPSTRALIFTAFDDDDRIVMALEAGAQGYLLKGTPPEELVGAIRIVHAGGSVIQPTRSTELMARSRRRSDGAGDPADLHVPVLSPRESEVLRLLARGLLNKEIAHNLGLSERTVKFHITSIFTKLGVGNRTEAVTTSVQLGLIRL
jgi:DNA-binding NarL/FixJ family response regulator